MIKRLVIKLLFRLLGSPLYKEGTVNEDRMIKWAASQYPLKEFRDYIKKRDMEILQLLGNIVSREDYLIYIGQRTELGRILSFCKEMYEKERIDMKKKDKLKK
jgi:hypothetical protein